MPDEGFLYSLFGTKQRLWDELDVSLTSLRKTNPGADVCLVTDNSNIPAHLRRRLNTVVTVDQRMHHFKLKVLALLKTPYKRTVFLDLDTKVKGDLSELFEFLRHYDVAVAPDPLCDWDREDYFVAYFNLENLNTGMLAYQMNDVSLPFFNHWLDSYLKEDDANVYADPDGLGDQVFFNRAVAEEKQNPRFGIKLLVLPNTVYNARPWIWRRMKTDGIRKRTKILHAHNLPKTRLLEIKKNLQFRLKQLMA